MTGNRTFTVLLADDVAALRKLVRIGIEAGGRFRVVGEAATGLQAIDVARQLHPDLVLLDLSMPELDGLEALPRVLEAAPHTHVVVLSGFNHVRMAPVATRLGASAYLEKGMEPARLVAALLAVLEPGPQAQAAAPPQAGVLPPSPPVPPPHSTPTDPRPPRTEAVLPPIVRSLDLPDPHESANGHDGISRGPPRAKAASASFRVLLVEPDPVRTSELQRLLTSFDTLAVASLGDATDRLDSGDADVVVVHPAGSAAEVEDHLVELLTHAATVPVVAVLGPGQAELTALALRLGVEDCLPFEDLDHDRLARGLRYAIERRHSLEARLQVRRREDEISQLREIEQVKTQFFNTAAHELGTPLTPIRIQVALLKGLVGKDGDQAGRRSLEILERNVRRLSSLNQDILDVARLQAHHLSLHPRPTDLRTTIQDVIDTFESTAQDAGLRLASRCPSGLVVEADPERLSQVLFNLVSNAIKFTPRGGTILVEGVAGAEECHVQVRDDGVGLTSEQIGALFKPFSQVLGEDQPRGVGTGLGLFISRGIAELHGGRLGCESPGHGKGSTFTLTLPRSHAVVNQAPRSPSADKLAA